MPENDTLWVLMYHKLKHGVVRRLMRYILKFHNLFYGLSGYLSQFLEPGGVHPKHRLTDYHRWFVGHIDPEWSVLDVGCGNGALTSDLAKHCKRVVGIDISSLNIARAKKAARADFVCADVTNYNFNGKFDCIVLSNVLEHINKRVLFLQKLKDHSARFLIRVPMLDRDWITLYKKEFEVEYRLDPTHCVEYTLDDFKKEMSDAGLKIESYRICYGEIYAVVISGDL